MWNRAERRIGNHWWHWPGHAHCPLPALLSWRTSSLLRLVALPFSCGHCLKHVLYLCFFSQAKLYHCGPLFWQYLHHSRLLAYPTRKDQKMNFYTFMRRLQCQCLLRHKTGKTSLPKGLILVFSLSLLCLLQHNLYFWSSQDRWHWEGCSTGCSHL